MKNQDLTPLFSPVIFGFFSIVIGLLDNLFPNSLNGTYLKLLF